MKFVSLQSHWNMFARVDLEEKLREKQGDVQAEALLAEVRAILNEAVQEEQRILHELNNGSTSLGIPSPDALQADRIFHIDAIRELCIEYRLRFLPSDRFKGEIPHAALAELRRIERGAGHDIGGHHVVAPSSLFRLDDPQADPMLFVPVTADHWYLVHRWGNDMKWYRRLVCYPVRDVYAYIHTLVVFSALLALLVPGSWLEAPSESGTLVMRYFVFLYSFVAMAAMSAFLGFQFAKNFSANLWDSRHFRV
jgi:hypothetical protein